MNRQTNTAPFDRQNPACKIPSKPTAAPLGPEPFSDHRLEWDLGDWVHSPLTANQAAWVQSFCQTHPDFKGHPDHVEPHPWQAEMQRIREAIPNSNVEDERPTFSEKRFNQLRRDLNRFKVNYQQLACLSEVAAMFMLASAEKAPPPKPVVGVVVDDPPFEVDIAELIPLIPLAIRIHDWLHARKQAVTGTSATGCPCGGSCGRNRGAPNAAQKGGEDNRCPESRSPDQDDRPGQPQEARNAVPPWGACNAEDRRQGSQQPRPRHRRPARQPGGTPSQPTTGGQA